MKRFINRHDELKFLEKEYQHSGASFVVLYGRRRVGKTALLTKFLEDKPGIYFLATQEPEVENRNAFKKIVADYINNSLLETAVIDWHEIFKTLMDFPHEQKLIIVIDEFQYLGKTNPAFPSVFQKIFDTLLFDKSVMVILCGSLISMMVSQTLAYDSPLYGRRTGQKMLKQINFSHYKEFFENLSHKDLIEHYAVTGGVPKYIEQFQNYESDIYSAIKEKILDKSSFLYEEPHFLLQNEVSEIGNYFSAIKTIAAGNQKLAKIASSLEVKQTGLTKYLKILCNLDILERQVPVTEEQPEKSKKGLYKIKDNYISFWFRFVYPNLSFLERDQEEIVMEKIRRNFIDSHVAYVYEDVCLSTLWKMNSEGKWPFYFSNAGRWWDNKTEIDIVAYDQNNVHMIFGECKYHKNPIDIDVFYDLVKKTEAVTWKQNERKNWYVLFSISGFTDQLQALVKERDDIILSS